MRKKYCILFVLIFYSFCINAHFCNDLYAQLRTKRPTSHDVHVVIRDRIKVNLSQISNSAIACIAAYLLYRNTHRLINAAFEFKCDTIPLFLNTFFSEWSESDISISPSPWFFVSAISIYKVLNAEKKLPFSFTDSNESALITP